jgi:hypothetical protein
MRLNPYYANPTLESLDLAIQPPRKDSEADEQVVEAKFN